MSDEQESAVSLADEPVEDEAPAVEAEEPKPGFVLSGPMRLTALVLVILAVIAAIVCGWLWYSSAHDDNLTFSRTRDSALQAAETGAVNFTTLDYKNIQQGLDRWKQSATGDLYTQLTSGLNTFEQQVQTAKVTTVGKVVDGAVVSLDAHAGNAEAIVLVDVTVTPSTGAPATKRLPLDVTLTNTGSQDSPVWKLSKLQQISTGSATGQ